MRVGYDSYLCLCIASATIDYFEAAKLFLVDW